MSSILLSLIEKKNGNKTRIKVTVKEYENNRFLRKSLEKYKLERKSSRYMYFIADEDLMNKGKDAE